MKAIGGVLGYVGLAVAATMLGLCLLYWQGIDPGQSPGSSAPAATLFFVGIIILGVWLNARAQTLGEKAQEEYARLSVTPVIDESLPSAEILLRGASKPPTPERELLRMSTSGKEAPAEELLRAVAASHQYTDEL